MSDEPEEPDHPELTVPETPPREPDEDADEAEDPLDLLRDRCRQANKPLVQKLMDCNDRVDHKEQITENCSEELFDLLHAVDKCVAKDLFARLK